MEPQKAEKNTLNQETITLYEDVLSKNFEIIENFLTKFHDIFSKHQEVQIKLEKFSQQLEEGLKKFQNFSEEIKKENERFNTRLMSISDMVLNNISQQKTENIQVNNKATQSFQLTKQIQQMMITIQQQQRKLETSYFSSQSHYDEKIRQFDERIQNLSINLRNYPKIQPEDFKLFMNQSKQFIAREISEKIPEQLQKQKNKCPCVAINWQKILQELKLKIQTDKKNIVQKIKQIQIKVQNKVSTETLHQQLTTLNDDLQQLAQQSSKMFAKKQQTKKTLHLLQRKVKKLQLVHELSVEKEKNDTFNPIHTISPAQLTHKKQKSTMNSSFGVGKWKN